MKIAVVEIIVAGLMVLASVGLNHHGFDGVGIALAVALTLLIVAFLVLAMLFVFYVAGDRELKQKERYLAPTEDEIEEKWEEANGSDRD